MSAPQLQPETPQQGEATESAIEPQIESVIDPVIEEDELIHWLALRVTPNLGPIGAVKLIRKFGTPQAIFQASKEDLERTGIPAGTAASVASGCAFDEAVTQHQKLIEAGAHLIPITHAAYPKLLKEIPDAPPVLFARGHVDLLHRLSIAVVGTRRPTAYGKAAAGRLAQDLANAGLVITSGMARGIDTSAHRAALDATGDTIAVFGCGVDELYPAENRKLADEIAQRGLILSDFPMATPPYPQHFPMRNRIVSGISVGVLVIEGGEYSGSAITARIAAEQGRTVFAVPGNITSRQSWGPNLLIKQGAKLVQEWNDVIAELEPADRRRLVAETSGQLTLNHQEPGGSDDSDSPDSAKQPGTPVAREILATIPPDQPVALDHLLESKPHISASEVMAVLFDLELSGMIRQLPGKYFVKVWQR